MFVIVISSLLNQENLGTQEGMASKALNKIR